jgi:ribosomal protein S18 acetylase RimI-like enzyme
MIHIDRVHEISDELAEIIDGLVLQLTGSHGPSRDELKELISSPASILLIARFPGENGPVVGMATLAFVRTPTGLHARLEDVVVDQTARGQGIGEALTREVIRLARASRANYLALTSNPRREAANRLYQRLGFSRHETNAYKMEL